MNVWLNRANKNLLNKSSLIIWKQHFPIRNIQLIFNWYSKNYGNCFLIEWFFVFHKIADLFVGIVCTSERHISMSTKKILSRGKNVCQILKKRRLNNAILPVLSRFMLTEVDACVSLFLSSTHSRKVSLLFSLIGIHSMQGWTTKRRHGVTRKSSTKRLKYPGNLFRKNL